jgi:arylsulfatase A-like enzyme
VHRWLRARIVIALVGAVLSLASVLTSQPGRTTSAAANPAGEASAPGGRPNVVVVMTDDMRADELLFAPQVRKLVARRGLTFENSFSPFPLCCPARASFLTGVYAHNHHVYWHEPPYGYGRFDDSRTIATSLRAAGYQTGFVGKYLNRYGVDRSRVSGKPSWRYVPRGWTDWRAAFESPGLEGVHGGTYFYFDTPYNVNGRVDNTHRGRYQTDVIGDFSVGMARRFAERRRASGKPFFMYVNYVAPHHGGPVEQDDPRNVAGGDDAEFATPARPRWVRGRFDGLIRRASGLPRGGGPSEKDMSDKHGRLRSRPVESRRERRALAEVTRQRAESIYALDRQVGRLVRRLKASGEWDRTIFVFTSDNGYFLGEHRLRTGKVRTYEPSLRVPLVVTGPGMRDGERRYEPITTVDLSATVLDAAGARPPFPSDGESRLPSMREGDRAWQHPVLTEFYFPGWRRNRTSLFSDERTAIGVRVPRYSYTRYRGFEELYDLVEDPYQDRNVAGRPAYADVRRELRELTRQTADCVGAACRPPLPESLAADAGEVRGLTRAWWADIRRRYGW